MIPNPTAVSQFESLSTKASSLIEWLQSSSLALVLESNDLETSRRVESELRARLSFNWILPNAPAQKSVAVVNGGYEFDLREKTFTHRGTFDAAKALDIKLIILDRSDHWLSRTELPDWDFDFIPIDTTIDEHLPQRICAALQDVKIDGLLTFTQDYLVATSQAAGKLGLKTEPVGAFEAAQNKYETRLMLGTHLLKFDSVTQLQDSALGRIQEEVGYPLIVKPCEGCGSRGVSKAVNEKDLLTAVHEMTKAGLDRGILIEPYIDGPEVDANFVLWNGEILFCEITDELPTRGDESKAGSSEPFLETNMLYPSEMPESEQEIIKTKLHENVLRLGFRSGIFHVEARVRHSSVAYQEKDGVVDLSSSQNGIQAPEVYLLEVNARPPGQDAVYATLFAHGVDYFGLHLLNAIGDETRYRALAPSFTSDAQQLWTSLAFIPMLPYPVHIPANFNQQLLSTINISQAKVIWPECFRPDETVSTDDGTGLIATYAISSSYGRKQALQAAKDLEAVALDILLALPNLSKT